MLRPVPVTLGRSCPSPTVPSVARGGPAQPDRFLFERAGAIVQTATSAEDAIEIMDTWEPDILVSDIGMPNVDGFELIKRIRARKQGNMRLPAVALTALTRIEDRVKALSAGYHMHVAKPIEPAELLSIVASLAGLSKR